MILYTSLRIKVKSELGIQALSNEGLALSRNDMPSFQLQSASWPANLAFQIWKGEICSPSYSQDVYY